MRRAESTVMDAMRHVPAFEALSDAELQTLRSAFSIAKYTDGERVFNQHDEGDKATRSRASKTRSSFSRPH